MAQPFLKNLRRLAKLLAGSSHHESKSRPRRRRLVCEPLEERRLLAVLDLSALVGPIAIELTAPGSTVGFKGTATGIGAFDDITEIIGSAGSDTLTGMGAVSAWDLDATQTYTSTSVLTFSAVETLQGGSDVDTFNVKVDTTADLQGGAGADVFAISDGVTLTGLIDGEADSDTLDLSAYTTSVTVTLTGNGTTDGSVGTATGLTGGFDNTDVVQGGTDADTFDVTAASIADLQGSGGADVFNLSAALTGNISAGAGADVINFLVGGSVTGIVDGGSSATLDFSAQAGPIAVVLTGLGTIDGFQGTATGIVGTFDDITEIIGSAGSDTLTGMGAVSAWDLDATQTYTSTSVLTFSAVETLQGGSDVDTFNVKVDTTADLQGGAGADVFAISDGVTLTGLIDGEADSDTLDLSAYTTSVTVTLTGNGTTDGSVGTATGLTGGFDNTDVVQGGTDADTFDVTAASIADLQGSGGADVFNLSAALTGNISAGAGADVINFLVGGSVTGIVDGGSSATLDFSAQAGPIAVVLTGLGTIDGFQGTATGIVGTFDDITEIIGSAGSDTLTGMGAVSAWDLDATQTYTSTSVLTFSAVETLQGGSDVDTFNVKVDTTADLQGGAGADVFAISDGVTLTGLIDGEADSDTLDLSAYTTSVTVTLTGNGTTDGSVGTATGLTGGFDNIDVVQGGTDADTFDVTAASIADLQGSGGADVFNLSAALTGNISAGAGADVINFLVGGSVTGIVDGGSSATLDFSAQAGPIAVVLTGLGTIDGFQGTATGIVGTFDDITEIIGSAGSDTLTGMGAVSAWDLDATQTYTSTSVLTFSAVETLQGGSDVDTFNVKVDTTADLQGGAGADVFAISDGVTLTGLIDGEADSDTLDLSAYTTSVTVTLTGNGTTDGSLGTATGLTGGFDNIDVVQGGTDADTFDVTAASTADLQGGASADVFDVDATLTGSIDGEAGSDTLEGDVIDDVTLTGSTANGYAGSEADVTGGFAGIDTLTGTGAGGSLLTGEDVASTWNLDTAKTYNDGSANSLTFSGFETLQGGSDMDTFNVTAATTENLQGGGGADVFKISATKTLTGTIDGEDGSDTLDYSTYIAGQTVAATLTAPGTSGFGGTATGISATLANIDVVKAGAAKDDKLTGDDAVSTWTLGTTRTYLSGGQTVTFSGFETLQGGSDVDTMIVQGTAGNDYYCVDENANTPVKPGTILRGATAGGTADLVIGFANFEIMEIDGLGGNDYVTFHVFDTTPTAMEFRFDGGTGANNGLKIVGTGAADKIGVGVFGSAATLSSTTIPKSLATDPAVQTQVYNPGPKTWTGVNFTVAQRFKAAQLAFLQMFGQGGDDVLVNNTAIRSLMDGGTGSDTLVGGAANDVLLGAEGLDTLYGQGGSDYLFADYKYEEVGTKVNLKLLAPEPGDFLCGGAGINYAVGSPGDLAASSVIVGPGLKLDIYSWLKAKFTKDVKSVIKKALAEPSAVVFPKCPVPPPALPPKKALPPVLPVVPLPSAMAKKVSPVMPVAGPAVPAAIVLSVAGPKRK